MQITRSKIQYLPTTIMIVVGVLVWVLMESDVTADDYHNAKYTESAHGDSIHGVNRSGLSGYSPGNCAHCHEQHASIGGVEPDPDNLEPSKWLLFAPTNPDNQYDNFCFKCHCETTSSKQSSMVENKDYSSTFGGGGGTFGSTNIKQAFSFGLPPPGESGSSHNLSDVGDAGETLFGFASDTNPCVACHDPHYAQKNFPVTDSPYGTGGVKTAIRLPDHYSDKKRNLWGDENFGNSVYKELTSDLLPNNYQSPYFKGWSTTKPKYEPGGNAINAISDGSNLPNFGSFCYSCHRDSRDSRDHQTVKAINFGSLGDKHGARENGASNFAGSTIAPYTADDDTNYILTCTDCHEPHGSKNEWLLRTCVNGKDDINITEVGHWYEFCAACHKLNTSWGYDHNTWVDCSECHYHNAGNF